MKLEINNKCLLFDLDGTLLDQKFDNQFWNHVIPSELSLRSKKPIDLVSQEIQQAYYDVRGTLNWYCINYWSKKFRLNIFELTQKHNAKICVHEGATDLLKSLSLLPVHLYLVTNAHPDILKVKFEKTNIDKYFNEIFSSHSFGYPKESIHYWRELLKFLPQNKEDCILIDDNEDVIETARNFGIGQCITVTRPDTSQPPNKNDGQLSLMSVSEMLHWI